jgi:hypothetical protein
MRRPRQEEPFRWLQGGGSAVRVALRAATLALALSLHVVRAGFDDYAWSYPVAPHMLLIVEPGGQLEFSLPGYDLSGQKVGGRSDWINVAVFGPFVTPPYMHFAVQLTATISALPGSGTLYQLSKVYNDFG